MQKIIRNRIKCLKCGNIIESKYRHNFIWCPCGSCAVDGGTSYLKRAWRPDTKGFEEMSVVEIIEEDKNENNQTKLRDPDTDI